MAPKWKPGLGMAMARSATANSNHRSAGNTTPTSICHSRLVQQHEAADDRQQQHDWPEPG
jgi:hypothetical protein